MLPAASLALPAHSSAPPQLGLTAPQRTCLAEATRQLRAATAVLTAPDLPADPLSTSPPLSTIGTPLASVAADPMLGVVGGSGASSPSNLASAAASQV